MSTTTSLTPSRSFRGVSPSAALVLAWVAVVVALAAPAVKTGVFDAMSTDDAMRLVEVRDLIGGQGWFDLTQHRLDPPGVPMHWSRIVDLPLAAIILCAKPLIGQHGAEIVALVAWPSLLWAAALSLVALVAGRLAAAAHRDKIELAAILLAALSIPSLIHFRAGAIDHHNAQIVLLLAFVLCASQIEKGAAMPVLAGAAASLSLAIGVEMLPAIALVCVAVAGLLIWEGRSAARSAGLFGAALAGCSLVLTAALLPIESLAPPVCDSNGGPLLLLTAGGGGGLLALAAMTRFTPTLTARLVAGAAVAVMLLAAFAWLFPGCVASPYAAVDPLLAHFWLDRVAESLSLPDMLQLEPQKIAGFHGFPILTLGICVAVAATGSAETRFSWIVASVALAALIGISVWELRGAAAANLVAAPLFAAGIARLRPAWMQGWKLLQAAILASPASLAGLGLAAWPLLHHASAPQGGIMMADPAASCETVSSMAALAQLPPGRVMAPIDSGPAILAATGHAVFAAPYHRNNAGNRAMLDVMLAAPEAARQLLADRRVGYVLICPMAPDQKDFEAMAPDGLAARLARGDVPDFLDRVALTDAPRFSLWRVSGPGTSPR
jgi:hypothetical protein